MKTHPYTLSPKDRPDRDKQTDHKKPAMLKPQTNRTWFSRASVKKSLKDTFAPIHTSTQTRANIVEWCVASFVLFNIFAAIVLFYTDADAFFLFTREDGFIEYATALFLLASSLVCAIKAYSSKNKKHVAFYGLAAVVFFLGFGEEISWGQRIFAFSTPENLALINEQNEFTIHNITLYGISFKKVLFRLILNSCVLLYFVGFPILLQTQSWFRKLINAYGVPVPTPAQAALFLLSFVSVFLIDEGKKWELAELAISCFTFLAFSYSSNRNCEKI